MGKVPNQSYFSNLNFRVAFISVLGSTTLLEAVQTEKIKIPTVIEPLEKHAKNQHFCEKCSRHRKYQRCVFVKINV